MTSGSWERAMLAVFDDLEQQAEGLVLAERASEVGELSVASYAEIEFVSRVHASFGLPLTVQLAGGTRVRGTLRCAGSDWMLLGDTHGVEWVVAFGGVLTLGGASARAVAEEARSLPARLGMRSVLRRIARERETCAVLLTSGTEVIGRLGRIGVDFAEIHLEEVAGDRAAPSLIRISAIAAVRGRG